MQPNSYHDQRTLLTTMKAQYGHTERQMMLSSKKNNVYNQQTQDPDTCLNITLQSIR